MPLLRGNRLLGHVAVTTSKGLARVELACQGSEVAFSSSEVRRRLADGLKALGV